MAYKLEGYTDKERMDFIVTYNHNMGLEIAVTEDGTYYALLPNEIMVDDEPQVDPDYEEKQRQKEKARIQTLSMTRSDFFDGTIRAFGVDDAALLQIVQAVVAQAELPEVEKQVAINNFKNALNFYRKHPLFTMLSGTPIPMPSNTTVIITAEQWDTFFDETDKKNPDAYKALLPPQEEVEE